MSAPPPFPRERAQAIALVIFDVDGVLTDGSLFLADDGREYKIFNARDGHGMVMLMQTGVEIAIISGRRSEAVRRRMEGLGVRHLFQGCRDKLPVYHALRDQLGLGDARVAYVGDDVVDLPVMRRVGLSIAVGDAHPLVLRQAHWQTPSPGGRGAAREVCERIMEAQGTLAGLLQGY